MKFLYKFSPIFRYSYEPVDGAFMDALVRVTKRPYEQRVWTPQYFSDGTIVGEHEHHVRFQYTVYVDLWLIKLRWEWEGSKWHDYNENA